MQCSYPLRHLGAKRSEFLPIDLLYDYEQRLQCVRHPRQNWPILHKDTGEDLTNTEQDIRLCVLTAAWSTVLVHVTTPLMAWEQSALSSSGGNLLGYA